MRLASLAASLLLALAAWSAPSPIAGAKQLIVVIAPDWNEVHATMTAYELRDAKWERIGAPLPVILGRTGLAWGIGLNRETGDGPVKHEGDGKSPAGVFALGSEFGVSPTPLSRLPYVHLLDTTECVDDVKSSHYNTIVDRAAVPEVDWSSSEQMAKYGLVYQHGIVVLHNTPPTPGGGSCIFLHLVGPVGAPTAGCTAMSAGAMQWLLKWLDPAQRPLLVQLPRDEYDRLRPLWRLP